VSKFVFVLGVVLVLFAGCGEADTSSEPAGHGGGEARLERQMQRHRAATRRAKARQHARAAARRHHRQLVARHHRAQVRAEEAERRAAEAAEEAEAEELVAEEAAAEEEEASECDPNYSGACLDPYISDYDCEGGSGDGPAYTGTVAVVGEDHYGLDADSDGTGCEPS
jgi:membrane protein involved in colicin uptake